MELDSPQAMGDSYPFIIVGIGASAGGLEALERLFKEVPATSGMAFVILQHLSPDFESKMDELLARHTSLPVHTVVNGVRVEPDHIYLIPPRKEMIITGGRLLLTDKDPERGFSLPIDHFFRSLAAEVRHRAVGVVLSGTGSDGTRGVRAIHDAGGLVIAQSPESARFDGMPRSAHETGVCDLVLPPERIPRALLEHARSDLAQLRRHPPVDRVQQEPTALGTIFELLRAECGIDFAYYKPNTVLRRVDRRMSMTQTPTLEDYALYLENHPAEVDALYRDLLIGVTQFFRDPEVFERLESQVIPDIIARAQRGEELRVWVAGCATGEEAYSLAILFDEHLEQRKLRNQVKIFATDVHRRSLEVASAGFYSDEALASLSPQRRDRYFVEVDEGWQIAPELREMIVFARHNVVSDAPFTRLDLISCRNLLIYLQPNVQQKVLSLFHFALRTGGALLLGMSESPGDLRDEFEALDDHAKIFTKRRDVRLPVGLKLSLAGTAGSRRASSLPASPAPFASRLVPDSQLLPVYDRLLDKFMPPGFLLDHKFGLVHSFAGAEQLTHLRGGRPSANILELIEESFKTSLSGALQHAEREGKLVRYSGIEHNDRHYRLTVEPIHPLREAAPYYVVTLEDLGESPEPSTPPKEVDVQDLSREYIRSLEADLRFTQENLQATIEELETSNEELQATNEELVASNEELQSTNEELHSVNEELYTVNVEHQRKIAELTEMTADMENLLQNVDVGVVFLDPDLRIRKFTSKIARAFHILPQDVGRRFDHFAHNIEAPTLFPDLETVLRCGEPIEHEVSDSEGRHFFMRILPYRAAGRIDGVVLTLIDIEALKIQEAKVGRLSAIVEQSSDAIFTQDLDGRISTWNRGAASLFGYEEHEALGEHVRLLMNDEDADALSRRVRLVHEGQMLAPFELRMRTKNGRALWASISLSPVQDANQRPIGVSVIGRDITERKEIEHQVRDAVRQRDRFFATLSHELRNPLTTLLSASRVLLDTQAETQLKDRATQMIRRQTQHMARLLDDLLDVARFRQDKIAMRKHALDLREPVRNAIESCAALGAEAQVTVDLELSSEPVGVHGDPDRLQQAVVNLVNNAIKYSRPNSSVRVALTQSDGIAELVVEDHGIGISPEVLPKIFDPFVQEESSTDFANGGMGLGLALVRAIVEGHDGEVKATSDGKDRGSRFLLRLPLQGQASRPTEPASRRLASGDGVSIVLVEDESDNRELFSALLRHRGFQVASAADGRTGIQLVRTQRPEVALLDIGLPGMSGVEVARALRREFSHDQLRLIALTGYGQESDRQLIQEAGFDAHLVKPVDIEELMSALESLRRHSHQTEA